MDSLPNARKKKVIKDIPHIKHANAYPAVLIGRLGVNTDFKGKYLGKQLMDFIKAWFIDPHNKTGCRFITVDAYNEDIPQNYYLNNGFEHLFSSSEQEIKHTYKDSSKELKTRLMYFDLIRLIK